jgi:hypothetical protein
VQPISCMLLIALERSSELRQLPDQKNVLFYVACIGAMEAFECLSVAQPLSSFMAPRWWSCPATSIVESRSLGISRAGYFTCPCCAKRALRVVCIHTVRAMATGGSCRHRACASRGAPAVCICGTALEASAAPISPSISDRFTWHTLRMTVRLH